MPIRNFYIDCEIDGRKSRLTGGPKPKDGGFNLTIYQLSEGEKIIALDIVGTVSADGTLVLDFWKHDKTILISSLQERLRTNR